MGAGGFPTNEVWSPAGGWYCDPRYWRRNTFLALGAVACIAVPVFLTSAKLEKRPHQPTHAIPSQIWCKNFGAAAVEQ